MCKTVSVHKEDTIKGVCYLWYVYEKFTSLIEFSLSIACPIV